MKSNLEPIEESDLDLEGKIKRGSVDVSRDSVAPFEVEKEISQEISAAEKDNSYGKILAKVHQSEPSGDIHQESIMSDAKEGAQKIDAESQVQHLMDLASNKGVVHAVKVAQHMQDNYVLDMFRNNMLSDEFHDALVKKGMIKEI